MDPKAYVLGLLAPLRPGDELVPGSRLLAVSTEVGVWLSFDVAGAEVQIEIAPLGDRRFAVRTSRFGVSYRSEGGRNPIDSTIAFALCRQVAARVAKNEARADLSSSIASLAPAARIRDVAVESALEAAGHGDERFYKLSPYAGCLIGCRYCYAQAPMRALRQLEQLPEVPWGSYVDVRSNIGDVLRAELATMPSLPIKFCPILSDPYQAIEERARLTRACLEVIRDAGSRWTALVLTRSKLVVRDVDLFASMSGVWVGASIPTADDEVRRHFEPRAASIPERFEALSTLKRAGARTFAVVQPILPGSITALADALAETVASVSIDVLRGEEGATADFDAASYAPSRDAAWQRERATELAEALDSRGVGLWRGELPPGLGST